MTDIDKEHFDKLADSTSNKIRNFLRKELEAIPLNSRVYLPKYPRMSARASGLGDEGKSAIQDVISSYEILEALAQEMEAEITLGLLHQNLRECTENIPALSKYDENDEIADMFGENPTSHFFEAMCDGFYKSDATWAIISIEALTVLMSIPESGFVREFDSSRDCCLTYSGKFMGKRLYLDGYSPQSDIILGKNGAIEFSNGNIHLSGKKMCPASFEEVNSFEHSFAFKINPEKLDRINVCFASMGCFI